MVKDFLKQSVNDILALLQKPKVFPSLDGGDETQNAILKLGQILNIAAKQPPLILPAPEPVRIPPPTLPTPIPSPLAAPLPSLLPTGTARVLSSLLPLAVCGSAQPFL